MVGGAVSVGVALTLSKTLRLIVRNALGGVSGVAKVTVKTLAFPGGFVAISILTGAYLGQLAGKKAIRRWGFRDPPQELTPYPDQVIHHIEILSPSIFARSLDAVKNTKDKIFSVVRKHEPEARDSLVLCIVTRFKPRTGELKSSVNQARSEVNRQEKSRAVRLIPVSQLRGAGQGLLVRA